LPEIPPDTPETNPIMCLDDHPQFSKISADMVITGCAKLSIDFDVHLGKHIENLKGELCTVHTGCERRIKCDNCVQFCFVCMRSSI